MPAIIGLTHGQKTHHRWKSRLCIMPLGHFTVDGFPCSRYYDLRSVYADSISAASCLTSSFQSVAVQYDRSMPIEERQNDENEGFGVAGPTKDQPRLVGEVLPQRALLQGIHRDDRPGEGQKVPVQAPRRDSDGD